MDQLDYLTRLHLCHQSYHRSECRFHQRKSNICHLHVSQMAPISSDLANLCSLLQAPNYALSNLQGPSMRMHQQKAVRYMALNMSGISNIRHQTLLLQDRHTSPQIGDCRLFDLWLTHSLHWTVPRLSQ